MNEEARVKNEQERQKEQRKQLVEKWTRADHKMLPRIMDSSDGKWDAIEGIESNERRLKVAQLLENSKKFYDSMTETTRQSQVGEWEKFIFPTIRAAYANTMLDDIVSMQPMDAKYGQVFYMDIIYDNDKGAIKKGDVSHSSVSGPSTEYEYPTEKVSNEPRATGDGATAAQSGTLQWTPVRPGTVEFTDGSQEVTDDGNGNLEGDYGGSGSIDYTTGEYEFSFGNAPDQGDSIVANYEYDSECQTPPQMSLTMTSSPVEAEPYKLAALWCLEAQQNIQSYHGIDLQADIVKFAANEIEKSIMYQVVTHIQNVASAGNVVWDKTPPDDAFWHYHKKSFVGTLNEGSELIFRSTQRDRASWMICGTGVGSLLLEMDRFSEDGGSSNTVGMRKIGTIAGLTVYEAPFMGRNNFVLGRKGTSAMDTGYIYAPYLGLFTTPTVMLEDMKARKGMKISAARKVIDSGQYATGQIIES